MSFDAAYIAFRCTACNKTVFEDCELSVFDETADSRGDAVEEAECSALCECGAEHTFTIAAYGADYYEVEPKGEERIRVMLYQPPSIEDEEQFEMFLDPPDVDDPYRIFLRSSSGLAA
jgi:hypothetical protein